MGAFRGQSSEAASIDELLRRLDRQEFDLVAVGRPLLADPNWVEKIREGQAVENFSAAALGTLH
jgi:2,4-dienoyl-CoA reductase-like NADH-dependent reductase (Old Yellow Enzyme family)